MKKLSYELKYAGTQLVMGLGMLAGALGLGAYCVNQSRSPALQAYYDGANLATMVNRVERELVQVNPAVVSGKAMTSEEEGHLEHAVADYQTLRRKLLEVRSTPEYAEGKATLKKQGMAFLGLILLGFLGVVETILGAKNLKEELEHLRQWGYD